MARLDLTRHPHGHGIINTQPSCEYFMSNSIQPFPSISIADAQRDMRSGYYGGAPGMLTSALMWLVAGVVAARISPERAVWALFLGGMLIHPVSVLLTKALGRRGKHASGNPLASLAMATTFWLILSCPMAYSVSLLHIEWFFPAMMCVIGSRYLCFSTLFGGRVYWLCGGALIIAGCLFGRAYALPAISAFAGATIEVIFAIAIFRSEREAAACAAATLENAG